MIDVRRETAGTREIIDPVGDWDHRSRPACRRAVFRIHQLIIQPEIEVHAGNFPDRPVSLSPTI